MLKNGGGISVFGASEHDYERYAERCAKMTDEQLEKAEKDQLRSIVEPWNLRHDTAAYARRFLKIVEAEQAKREMTHAE